MTNKYAEFDRCINRQKLHHLCRKGRLEDVREFFANEPKARSYINEEDEFSRLTSVHEAVHGKNVQILQLLLVEGGQVNVASKWGETPLHIAAATGDVECIKLLLEYDADVLPIDARRRMPSVIAQQKKHRTASKILKTAEIKKFAQTNPYKLLNELRRLDHDNDLEKNCLEEALELAVLENNHNSASILVFNGARNIKDCLKHSLLKASHETAVALLLCYAAKIGDKDVIWHICKGIKNKRVGDHRKVSGVDDDACVLSRDFLPQQWDEKLTYQRLLELRNAANSIEMAYPVAFASHHRFHEGLRVLLRSATAQSRLAWVSTERFQP